MRNLLVIAVALLVSSASLAADLTVEAAARHRGPDADAPVMLTVTLDGPAPVEQVVESPAEVFFTDLEQGEWTVMVSAEGFDSESRALLLSGTSGVAIEIFPAADVRLFGRVADANGESATGTAVRVSGARIDVPRSAEVDEDGRYEVLGLPAGYYDVEFNRDGYARVVRADVDVLGDTQLTVVLPPIGEEPSVREFRRPLCATSGTPTGSALLALIGLALVRRR